jgi:orotidine-5'-phosphate decarboxylase
MRPGAPETAQAVGEFCRAFLDRAAGRVAAVKPQIAFFEALGWPGLRTLGDLLSEARKRELPVVLDAKRGDIGSTAAAYARAYLGAGAPLPADALTVNPYLGRDSLEPFVEVAEVEGAGLFVLVRTSNAGAGDLQDLEVAAPAAERLRGEESGWSSLGVVVGANWPEQSRAVRELLPRSLFLVPGYGAQGGSAAEAVAGFEPGPDGGLEGGIVNSSRRLLYPTGSASGDAKAWERAIDDALSRASEELAEAVAKR